MKDRQETIRIQAVARTIMYLPLFLANELGFFSLRGLQVETYVPGPGPAAAISVLSGASDLALGGLWRAAMYQSLGKSLVAIAAIARRCPMFLLGRPDSAAKGWKAIEGSSVILCNDAPSGWVVFQARLVARGVDYGKVRFMPDFSPTEGTELFMAGFGDYIYSGQPSAEQLLATKTAELVASMATEVGPLPWSVFMTTPTLLDSSQDRLGRFVGAIDAALQWMAKRASSEIIDAAGRTFSDVSPEILKKAIERYKTLAAWPQDATIHPEDVVSWQRLLLENGMLREPPDWSLIVDNTFAESASKANA